MNKYRQRERATARERVRESEGRSPSDGLDRGVIADAFRCEPRPPVSAGRKGYCRVNHSDHHLVGVALWRRRCVLRLPCRVGRATLRRRTARSCSAHSVDPLAHWQHGWWPDDALDIRFVGGHWRQRGVRGAHGKEGVSHHAFACTLAARAVLHDLSATLSWFCG